MRDVFDPLTSTVPVVKKVHVEVPTRQRHLRHVALLLAIVVSGAVLAACGGGGGPGVVSLGTTTTTNASTPATSSAQLDKYGACMRHHGLPGYQNPIVSGNSVTMQVGTPGALADSPQYVKAEAACRDLLPLQLQSQQSHTVPQKDQVDYLKAVACMRAHGFPQFPDPTFTGGNVKFNLPSSINQNSTLFVKYLAICRKNIPADLPYGS